jgi:hypothetical protein
MHELNVEKAELETTVKLEIRVLRRNLSNPFEQALGVALDVAVAALGRDR